MEPGRWPTAGRRLRSLKASPSPFDQCWNRGLQTVDAARCCVSPLSENQSVWVGDDCFHLQPPFYVKLLLEKRADPILSWCIPTYVLQEWNVVRPLSHRANSLRLFGRPKTWLSRCCHLATKNLIFLTVTLFFVSVEFKRDLKMLTGWHNLSVSIKQLTIYLQNKCSHIKIGLVCSLHPPDCPVLTLWKLSGFSVPFVNELLGGWRDSCSFKRVGIPHSDFRELGFKIVKG